jgi:nucleotide-binding universal stress UspA family protein
MKNILLPTDFSNNARVAADFTVNLLCGLPMSLNLYHFYGLHHSSGAMLISIDDLLQKDANASMNKEVKRVNDYCEGNVTVKSKNLNGKLTDFISEIVTHNKIDLIAMGTNGSSGFHKDLFGSNTTYILSTVKAPVLVIPENSKISKLTRPKIAFASDFRDFSSKKEFKSFMALMNQKYGSCESEVVYVSETNEPISSESKYFCSDLLGDSISQFVNIEERNIHQGLMHYLDISKPDILIMIHRKNSFIERLLKTSLSTKMALNSGTPLLIFKD